VTDDNAVLLEGKIDADVIQVNFTCRQSEYLGVSTISNLQDDDLGAGWPCGVFAHFVLDPDGKWVVRLDVMTLLDEHVLALTEEIKGASVERRVVIVARHDAASGAVRGFAGPLRSGRTSAFFAFGCV